MNYLIRTLLLLCIVNSSIFAKELPHLNLEKYDDEKKRAVIELANQYYLLNNKDKALLYLKSSIKKYTDFYDANIYIAHIYQTKKELKQSLKYIKKAIIIDSTRAEAFYYRGYYHLKKEDTLTALNDYTNAIISDPNFYHCYDIFNKLKNCHFLDDAYKSNIELKLKIKMEEKHYSKINSDYNFGLFYLKIGKNKEAIQLFKKCLTDKKFDAQSHFFMGQAYYYTRQYDDSLDSFALAAGLNYKTNETKRYLTHISRLNKIKKR